MTKNKISTKNYHLKWLSAAAFLLLLAILLMFGNVVLVRDYRLEEKKYIEELVGIIRTNAPNLSDSELIQLVRGGTVSKGTWEEGKSLLTKYGFDDDYFAEKGNELLRRLIWYNAAIIVITGGGFFLVYVFHRRRVRRRVEELQEYFEELNKGTYNLDIGYSEENELSMLQSDIFKVTQLLRTAVDESRKKSDEMTRWLADISHQLKTPIASIRINLDNMIDDPDMPPELRKEFLKECSMQLEWISSLVQTLLKLARIDAGAVEMKNEEMDLLEVAREAEKKLGILSEIAGVSIVWEEEPGGEEVDPATLPKAVMTGDAAWQLEAISNILKNCIEHSRAGSKVYLSMRSTSVFKELTIRDEGEGIPEEDLPHIFERFYRAKNAKRESVGIGLSLASGIVEAGEGKVLVSSTRGKGSTFVIRYLT